MCLGHFSPPEPLYHLHRLIISLFHELHIGHPFTHNKSSHPRLRFGQQSIVAIQDSIPSLVDTVGQDRGDVVDDHGACCDAFVFEICPPPQHLGNHEERGKNVER